MTVLTSTVNWRCGSDEDWKQDEDADVTRQPLSMR